LQFDDEESVCVALLHDVIEDHPEDYSFEYLEQQGFPKSIVDAIRLLTHDPRVEYLDYVKAIKDNPIARRVKIADLKHNMDTRRGGGVKPPKYDLYQEALKILEE
jgi:(p)ppGpp synthase/HD superfamily hydrolase